MSEIKRDVKETVAYVEPLENEVMVAILAEDGILFKDEARKLAKSILKAVRKSENLIWDEKTETLVTRS